MALDYFAVPDTLWPTGLQLLKRKEQGAQLWLQRDRKAARDIVKQISTLLLAKAADSYPRPDEYATEFQSFGEVYFKSMDEKTGKYCIAEWLGGTEGCSSDIPSTLKTAITQAGRHEHLRLTFTTHRAGKYSGWHCIWAVVTETMDEA